MIRESVDILPEEMLTKSIEEVRKDPLLRKGIVILFEPMDHHFSYIAKLAGCDRAEAIAIMEAVKFAFLKSDDIGGTDTDANGVPL